MATNKELEKRIETLEKEVQHLKAILQYQMRNNKKWKIKVVCAFLNHLVISFHWFKFFLLNIQTEHKEIFNICIFLGIFILLLIFRKNLFVYVYVYVKYGKWLTI